jgi:hypothetical protein
VPNNGVSAVGRAAQAQGVEFGTFERDIPFLLSEVETSGCFELFVCGRGKDGIALYKGADLFRVVACAAEYAACAVTFGCWRVIR